MEKSSTSGEDDIIMKICVVMMMMICSNHSNIIMMNCIIMNIFQAGFTPAQVAKRKFLLLGFSSCALALSCVSFSAAVRVNFNCLIAWLSLSCVEACVFLGFVCAYVYDFVLFCLRLSTAGMNVDDFLLISSITLVREN